MKNFKLSLNSDKHLNHRRKQHFITNTWKLIIITQIPKLTENAKAILRGKMIGLHSKINEEVGILLNLFRKE